MDVKSRSLLLALRSLVLGLLLGLGSTQPSWSLDPSQPMNHYVHVGYTTENGMPQDGAQVIYQSRDGYVWIGTQEGLLRFNGQAFKVFDNRNTPGISHNDIRGLAEDPSGRIWVGMQGGGVACLDQGKVVVTLGKDWPGAFVHAMTLAEDGHLWVGTNRGVVRVNTATGQWQRVSVWTDTPVRCLVRTRDGAVWVGDDAGQVHAFPKGDPQQPRRIYQQPNQSITALYQDRDGSMIFGIRGLGLHFQASGRSHRLPCIDIHSILRDRDGSLWVAAVGGLYRIHQNQVERWGSASKLGDDYIWSLLEDHEGSLWVGTASAGIHRFFHGRARTLGISEGLPNEHIRCFWQDRRGAHWIGTYGAGVVRIQDGQQRRFDQGQGLPSPIIRSMAEDPRGRLWVGTLGGVACIDGEAITAYRTQPALPNPAVYALLFDREGNLWVGMENGLLTCWPQGDPRRARSVESPARTSIRCLLQDQQGDVWFGTYGDGLFRVHQGRVSAVTPSDGSSCNTVMGLLEDAHGLWIGTVNDGLGLWRQGRFHKVGLAQGLPDHSAFTLRPEGADRLWITSNTGVWRLSRKDVVAVMEGRRPRIDSLGLGLHDGLRSMEFNGGWPCSLQDSHGTLWFPSNRGVVLIDPSRVDETSRAPAVVLEGWSVRHRNETSAPDAPGRELAPGVQEISFQFAALTFRDAGRVEYRYRLDGLDPDWVQAGNRRTAYYTNLPPGAFLFRVEARIGKGEWRSLPVPWAFQIKPYFHQTGAFYTLIAMGLLGLGAGFQAWRARGLRRRAAHLDAMVQARTRELALANQELSKVNAFKSMFLASTSHELRTPVTAILGLARLMDDPELPQGERRQFHRTIRRSAEGLLQLLNDLLDSGKIDAGRLDLEELPLDLWQVLEDACLLLKERAREKRLDLVLHIHPDSPRWILGDPLRLRQVVLNLLGNAVKFTDSGQVCCRLKPWPPGFQIDVVDTGVGMGPEAQARLFQPYAQADASTARTHGGTGLGLFISRQLLGLMGGTLSVVSEPGRGSCFTLTLTRPQAPEPPSPQESPWQGLRVAVVPPDGPCADLLRDLVRLAGARVDPDDPQRWLVDGTALSLQRPEGPGVLVVEGTAADRGLPPNGIGLTHPVGPIQFLAALQSGPSPATQAITRSVPRFSGRVLVADDDAGNRMVAEKLLRQLGLEVVTAPDGHAALECLAATPVDLVFLDGSMPHLDGPATARAIRTQEAATGQKPLPLVALTGHASPGSRAAFLAQGFNEYLAKPIDPDPLARIVAQLLPSTPAAPEGLLPPPDQPGAWTRLETALGGPEALDEFLTTFRTDLQTRWARMQALHDRGDLAQLVRESHDVKTNAGTLQFTTLSTLAARLEHEAETLGPEGVGALMEELAPWVARALEISRRV